MTCDVVQLVRKYAGAASDALLDPSCLQFYHPPLEGFIGYKSLAGCAIVLGDPVCRPEDSLALASAFQLFTREQNLSTIYMMTTERFTKLAQNNLCRASVRFGEELWIPLDKNPFDNTGEKASLLRRKVRHSQQEGVEVHEYRGSDPSLEQGMIALGTEWLNSREGLQIHTSKVRIFENRFGKRWFYALKDNKVIGVLILNRTESTNSYLLNRYMVSPKAPGGTPEALVMCAIDQLREEQCPALCCGIVISNKDFTSTGLSALQNILAKSSLACANRYFGLANRKVFWEKFLPETRSSNLLFETGSIGFKELMALSKALHITD
jgi:lysylphosphatidylglycerol synthetase-like protein (DUF2156 family)